MKRALLRFVLLYAGTCLLVLFDLLARGRPGARAFVEHCGLAGFGGVFVYLFLTRFGLGHADEAPIDLDEDALRRRDNRRSWLLAGLCAALALLATAALYPLLP